MSEFIRAFFKSVSPRERSEFVVCPAHTEVVTASEFLRIYETERDNIESAKVRPAPLGSNSFGHIVVKRKNPLYRAIKR